MRRRILLTSLGLALVPLAASAGPLARASACLVAAQRDAHGLEATWTWKRGSETVAPNSAGLVALALIRAWQVQGDAGARRAARRWGEARMADLAAWREVYDPDVEALAALARATKDARFRKAAREAFTRRWGEATPEEAFARIRQVRRGDGALLGYDVALTLRAARAVGAEDFARGLAVAALQAPALWAPDQAGRGWRTTSRAALLGAIEGLPGEALAEARARLVRRLLDAQGRDGAWAEHNTQATAYAVAALRAYPEAQTAVERGRAWLTKTQLADGSWAAFHDGLPEPFVGDVVHEVTAEVVLALASER